MSKEQFYEACVNENSFYELEHIIEQLSKFNVNAVADRIDCDSWEITPEEWAYAIIKAYNKKCL